ncbi:hypothetical protein ACA910_014551 [Epithemia clementina (nom. ined.)]
MAKRVTCCPCQQIRPDSAQSRGGVLPNNITSSYDRNGSRPIQSSLPPSSSSSSPVLCASCINVYLQEARQRRARVRQEHARWKESCQKALDASPPLAELQHELQRLHHESEMLRANNNQLALQTAKLACQNEERQAVLSSLQKNPMVAAQQQRQWLARFQSVLLDNDNGINSEEALQGGGALSCGIQNTRQTIRRLRFQWAVAAFEMHRLDVAPEHVVQRMTHRTKHARGIGKIAGLPLPHAGPELYGVLPPIELQSALRLVASLTSLVASCLGIRLPHPILLTPTGSIGDLVSQAMVSPVAPPPTNPSLATLSSTSKGMREDTRQQSQQQQEPQATPLASSTSSLASLVSQTSQRVLSMPTETSLSSTLHAHSATRLPPPSLDSNAVQQRIHHATCAVLAEKEEEQGDGGFGGATVASNGSPQQPHSVTTYSLSVAAMQLSDGEEFAIALQLLQNNIVALCIRAGAPVDRLMPAEAVLLNLKILHAFCLEQTQMLS